MRFAEPEWLWVGAVIVAALFVLRIRSERITTRALATLAGARLVETAALPSPVRRWLRVALATLAIAAVFVALARPQKGKEWQTLDRRGTDLLLLIDTSKSMNTDDVSPSRLERTKLAVRDLVARFPEDRIGLMAFAGDAYLESPLTLDHGALLETLDTFDTSLISRPGTDIGRAIDDATLALKADSGSQKELVLLSDGEDLEGRGLSAAKRASEAGIRIDSVGVGTPAGEIVPQKDERGATTGVLHDSDGNVVRSRLDEPGLRGIAQAAHGTYRPLGPDGRGLDRLYSEALAPLTHTEKGAKLRRVYAEWFALPLGVALFALAFDALLGFRPRRRTPKGQKTEKPSALARPAAVAATACVMLLSGQAFASPQSAENAYRAGKFDQAAREYDAERLRKPNDARLAIDAGAAAYRAGHFDAAEASWNKALTLADPALQQRVLYDLGDARYRLGAATVKDAPEKTKERWHAALDAYEGALKLAPKDADARFNRDFVKGKLAELEQKQKQTPPPPPQGGAKNQSPNQNAGGGASKQDKQHGQAGQGSQSQPGQSPGTKSDPKEGKNPAAPGTNPSQPQNGSGAAGQQAAKGETRSQGDSQGQQKGATDRAGEGAQASDGKDGKLSPDAARALVDSLKGEERKVRFGTSNANHDDDSSQKDW
jgi:Ca-activated chloride channel homolog